MAGDAIGAAIEAAEMQWHRLVSAGFEAYAAGLAGYGEACAAACQAFTSGPRGPEEARFTELIALDARIATELKRQKREVTNKLAGLNRGRRASGAYLSVAPPTKPAVAAALSRTRPRLEA
ncbi:MAG: hypothetical protein ACRDG3_00690 [Tepidiformaceae bacterium]